METFKDFVDGWTNFIGTSITGLFLTFATAVFFYAVVRFIMKRSSGDTKGLEDAKSMLGWSIIGLTVMFSIWGIVSFLQSGIFGENGNKTEIKAPSVSTSGSTSATRGTAGGASTGGSTGSTGGVKKSSGESCVSNSECTSSKCLANRVGKRLCI